MRMLDGMGLHSLWATAYLYMYAAVAVALWRPHAIREAWDSRGLWLLGIAAGITNAAFNWGMVVGEVVRVILLFYLMPVWAALLARWLLDERLHARGWARIVAAVAGAALVLWEPQIGLPLPSSLGDWLGLAGGVGFALTNVINRREARRTDAARSLAMFVGAVVVPGTAAVLLTAVGTLDARPELALDWMLTGALLSVVFLLANFALVYGGARLPATVTIVILTTEVLFAVVSAILLAGEAYGWRTIVGGTLIVGASLAAAVGSRRKVAATA